MRRRTFLALLRLLDIRFDSKVRISKLTSHGMTDIGFHRCLVAVKPSPSISQIRLA